MPKLRLTFALQAQRPDRHTEAHTVPRSGPTSLAALMLIVNNTASSCLRSLGGNRSAQKAGPGAPEVGVLLVIHHVAGVRHVVVLAEAAGQRPQQVDRQRSWAGLRLPARHTGITSCNIA